MLVNTSIHIKDKIWKYDASRPYESCQPIKLQHFKNPRWPTDAILKLNKIPRFYKSKQQMAAFLKIAKKTISQKLKTISQKLFDQIEPDGLPLF